ncbi:MAG TPA: hypothetical protein VEC39_00665 [Vicinamibacterales bacterium]|nr:hypothetical protein [Vicinamibacterales bacterium]
MRNVISAGVMVLAALFVEFDGVSVTPLAQDRVAGILAATRKAMGGEDKVAGVKTLTAEGPFRRMMGQRAMEGMVMLTIARPDKMHRLEDMALGGMVGGPSMERTMVLNGTTSWEDSQNRGGMGGGMRIMMAGPGGPAGAAATPEQVNEARTRRMRVQLQRLSAALFADAGVPWVDAGVAESPDGKADILEAKEETGRTLRLFIDQNSRLPLMVQYQDPKPMVMINGGPGGRGPGGPGAPGAAGGPPPAPPTPEEMQRRMAEMQRNPPQLGTFAMHLSDYKKVDGIMLPHKIETSLDGEPNEEWTIEKFKVNPQVKADLFEKK